mmetsp:Transcript_24346/g.62783  ORF Transcript_24346/g.62783 Transcript_24346/m.62783 type:complete len:355 (-) Transcript_24346:265-1329(-)
MGLVALLAMAPVALVLCVACGAFLGPACAFEALASDSVASGAREVFRALREADVHSWHFVGSAFDALPSALRNDWSCIPPVATRAPRPPPGQPKGTAELEPLFAALLARCERVAAQLWAERGGHAAAAPRASTAPPDASAHSSAHSSELAKGLKSASAPESTRGATVPMRSAAGQPTLPEGAALHEAVLARACVELLLESAAASPHPDKDQQDPDQQAGGGLWCAGPGVRITWTDVEGAEHVCDERSRARGGIPDRFWPPLARLSARVARVAPLSAAELAALGAAMLAGNRQPDEAEEALVAGAADPARVAALRELRALATELALDVLRLGAVAHSLPPAISRAAEKPLATAAV